MAAAAIGNGGAMCGRTAFVVDTLPVKLIGMNLHMMCDYIH
jgi:hypothetical protein